MNDHHSNRFLDGLILGAVIGAGAVFLFGTKSGKNLLKILSEQGLDGIKDLIEEYKLEIDEDDLEDESEEVVEKTHDTVAESKNHVAEKPNNLASESSEEVEEPAPKKRFFKRIRK